MTTIPRPLALLILLLVKQLSSINAFPLSFRVLSSKIMAAGRSTIIMAKDEHQQAKRPARRFRLHAAPPRRSGGGSGSTKKALSSMMGTKKSNGSKQKKGGLIFKQQPQLQRNGKPNKRTATSSRSQQQNPVEPGEGGEYSANLKKTSNSSKKVKIAPPWQVLNAKEAQKNVQKEIERRSVSLDDNYYTPSTENPNHILSKAFLSETEARLLSWKPFSPYSRAGGVEVEFVGAHTTTRPPRLGVPEIAFLGRSNCGKSSLLNALLRHDVARVGKTPGATASVNLYQRQNKR
jgi:hypothetical protein